MVYFAFNKKIINDFSDENINELYNAGYVFTREKKGTMYQTRSLRVDLSRFELSSENRRILRKVEDLKLAVYPLPYEKYSWEIGKMGKDFYETKFGAGTFSANKIKELMTDETNSNFNKVLTYCHCEAEGQSNLITNEKIAALTTARLAEAQRGRIARNDSDVPGYCICYQNNEILHYCYPFYSLKANSYQLPTNTGLGMMLKAIIWAKEQGKKYVYLGSASRPTDTYKLQFAGLEWWDGESWKQDIEELKIILNKL